MNIYPEDGDVVEQLRKAATDKHPYVQWWYGRLLARAADEIERLQAAAQ